MTFEKNLDRVVRSQAISLFVVVAGFALGVGLEFSDQVSKIAATIVLVGFGWLIPFLFVSWRRTVRARDKFRSRMRETK